MRCVCGHDDIDHGVPTGRCLCDASPGNTNDCPCLGFRKNDAPRDPVQRIVGWLDAELSELSRLHLAYENAGLDDDVALEAADELSAAVGKFLVTRGWEGKI